MAFKKLTKKKAQYFLKDEKHATKEYHQYGLNKLSSDEHRHAKFFQNKLKTL